MLVTASDHTPRPGVGGRRALETREKVLGAYHPDTLRSVGNLGILLKAKGDYDGAEQLFRCELCW